MAGLADNPGDRYAELPPETDPLRPRLAKPFGQQDLVQAVEQAMTGPSARRVLKFGAR